MLTSWGETFPEQRLTVAHVSPFDRARLLPDPAQPSSGLSGFQFAAFGDQAAPYEHLAMHIVGLLNQVDAWLRNHTVGPNIRPLRNEA
jgi:hypothetical protein